MCMSLYVGHQSLIYKQGMPSVPPAARTFAVRALKLPCLSRSLHFPQLFEIEEAQLIGFCRRTSRHVQMPVARSHNTSHSLHEDSNGHHKL